MTVRKALNLSQCRFLGDTLKMENFEKLFQESPRQFLQYLVHAFRINVPFHTVNVAHHLNRTGHFPTLSLDEARSEITSGRGGPCILTSPFMEDLLVSMGFRAQLIRAFNVSKKSSQSSFHCSPFVGDVETKGDLFHMDVGTSQPLWGLTEITNLVLRPD